jgi:hypothetical protein
MIPASKFHTSAYLSLAQRRKSSPTSGFARFLFRDTPRFIFAPVLSNFERV